MFAIKSKLLPPLQVAFCLFASTGAWSAETVRFRQNFDSAADLAAYVGSQPDRFDLVGATDGGEASISYGALVLSKSDQGKAAAYATRLSPLGLENAAVRVACSLTVSPDWSGSGSGVLTLSLGEDFRRNGNTAAAGRFAQLQIALDASPVFRLFEPVTRIGSRRLYANEKLRLGWFINGLPAVLGYTGPDGKAYTLEPRTMDVWNGPERLMTGLAVQGPDKFPRQLAFGIGGSAVTHVGFLIDDLVIAELAP